MKTIKKKSGGEGHITNQDRLYGRTYYNPVEFGVKSFFS